MKKSLPFIAGFLVASIGILFLSSVKINNPADPPAASENSVYYPNTEELATDEIRVIALGTGLPTPLTAKQKSSGWLVECGNGDKFLFDIGTGSCENLFALQKAKL